MTGIGCLASATAAAYVPPSFHVLKNLARKHVQLESGVFRHTVSFFRKNGEIAKSVNETLILRESGLVTVRVLDEAGTEIARHDRRIHGSKGTEVGRPVSYDLLFVRGAESLETHLKSLGLPVRPEAEMPLPYVSEPETIMSRFENRVAIVIGQSPETLAKGMQLWVEKDSLLPLRAVLAAREATGNEALEYRLSGYQVYKSALYPRTLRIFRNEVLWARVETQDVKLDVKGAALESAAAPAKSSGEPDSSTRNFLDDYFKYVR